ncbi:MAG TPA: magnesium transporter [Nocardioidaceae bacterium]|nr:magnesium transporter [Nocardioidaceae bacterium]
MTTQDVPLPSGSGRADAEPLLPGSIEQYLAASVPVCAPSDRAEAVRAAILGTTFDSVADVAVCVEREGALTLLGLIPAERLLGARGDETAESLMDPDPPVVAPGLSQEKAAWKAVQHGQSSLAVVDTDERFRGLVPPARLLGVLLREHDEDLARLGGVLSSTASARHATEERLGLRLWHRLPWLVLGLIGSAVAAWIVRGFEVQLEADLRLAFFVPGIVYMADAVGTQTEALVIRGLSVGVSVRRVFRLEVLTGLVVGLVVGAVTFPAVLLAFGSADLAAAISLALLAACGMATLVAMSLPWLMTRAGRDPAFGSGPLATVVQDLLSLIIYFAVAMALVT